MNEVVAMREAGCPFSAKDDRRTAEIAGSGKGPAIEVQKDGSWLLRSYSLARQVLKSTATRQAGFSAELMDALPESIKRPVIFLEGTVHNTMRAGTAKYFRPKAVADNYHAPMSELSDRIIETFKKEGVAVIDELALELAMTMTAQIVGLTESSIPGMAKRLERSTTPLKLSDRNPFRALLILAYGRWCSATFYLMDVRPAIRARRKQPRDDVISHLLSLGYADTSVLIEAATYAPAGMSTTREFITLAIWHLLDRPELRARFVAAAEEERRTILEEIVRLEPVVSQIIRRSLDDIAIVDGDEKIVIPKGTLLRVDTRSANHDEAAAGDCPFSLNPDREISVNMTRALLAFGDGIHRCPGSYVALQESAIFISKFLSVPDIHVVKPPIITKNPQIGYEVRGMTVAIGPK